MYGEFSLSVSHQQKKKFAISQPISVDVKTDMLVENADELNTGLNFILSNNITKGYLLRTPGNGLLFYQDLPEHVETQLEPDGTLSADSKALEIVSPLDSKRWYIFAAKYFI